MGFAAAQPPGATGAWRVPCAVAALAAAARVLAHERARGFALDRLWLYRLGNGWVASDRPLPVR